MLFKEWLDNKFRKKFLKSMKGYKLYSVDDKQIRDNSLADEEFSDYAIHDDFPKLIPEDELWLSDKLSNKELPIIIAGAIKRLKLLERGYSPDEAYKKAVAYEKRQRQHTKDNKSFKIKRLKVIYDPKDNIEVYLVNGKKVRDLFKVDYVEGGNSEAYKWMPKNEIWIEDDIEKSEIPAIIEHEYTEFKLMRDKHYSYDKAHRLASKKEYEFRKKHGI